MRLIDADALKIKLGNRYDKLISNAEFMAEGTPYTVAAAFTHMDYEVDSTPTVDAAPVRHGEWRTIESIKEANSHIDECSECGGTIWMYENAKRKWNFCPNCGAKMDGGAE